LPVDIFDLSYIWNDKNCNKFVETFETFPKESNCIENLYRKKTAYKKVFLKYFFFLNYFRSWSVLSPFDPFYIGNIKSLKMHPRNFTRNHKKCEWVIVVSHQRSNFSGVSWREHVNIQWDDESQEEEKSYLKL
jgi:hypothetical protein